MKKFKIIVITLITVLSISVVKYEALKANYINQYGVEIWNDMNQEVGINGELDSFIYYLVNGK